MDYSLEYVLNGKRSVVIKAIAEGVETATYTLATITAAAGVATLVGMLRSPLAAFGVFAFGEWLSHYISQKAKDITIDFFNEKIKYFPQTIDLDNGQYCKNDKSMDEILKNMSKVLGLSLFPNYSKEYKLALAKKKELITKTSIISKTYSFMDEEYLKDIQDLKEQEQIINQEEQKYQLALKFYKEDNKIKNEIFSPLFKSLNENLLIFNKTNKVLLNEKIAKETLEYDEDEYILFISHKAKLNNTYLKARKELYKSNASSMSNLIHLYENHCDVFIKDESLFDIKRIEKEYDIKFKEFNTRVFFYEKLLLGACEDNPFSFEEREENLLYHFKYDKEDLNSLKDL
ncbi:TPA: hypothetical protein RTH21_001666, partial [Campylobacter jejuni]|nr:hypothetical protein [Campylobacter jejuni]